MMQFLPSIRQLQYFQALSKTLHFGEAAQMCAVTQSTLSAGIRELEERLGHPLAERNNRSVVLTPFGREIARAGEQILLQAADLVSLAAKYREPLHGPLRLGVIPTIAPYMLPEPLRILRKEHPGLKLYLQEAETAELLDALNRGDLDLALIALPYDTGSMQTHIIADDPFYLVLPVDHELNAGEPVTQKQFPPMPLLLLNEGHCLRKHALAACSLDKRQEQVNGASLQTIVQMTANGLGTTLVPKMAIDSGILAGTGLCPIPLAGDHTSRKIALVWRSASARADEFKLLGDYLNRSQDD